jgi:hypothetical protein
MPNSTKLSYPKVGEVFELTIPVISPYMMLRWAGVTREDARRAENFRFLGDKMTVPIRGHFRIVQVGYQPNVSHLSAALDEKGYRPNGQIMKGFHDRYPVTDGEGPIGVLDSAWVHMLRGPCFPYIDKRGIPSLRRNSGEFSSVWRWIAGVSSPQS